MIGADIARNMVHESLNFRFHDLEEEIVTFSRRGECYLEVFENKFNPLWKKILEDNGYDVRHRKNMHYWEIRW